MLLNVEVVQKELGRPQLRMSGHEISCQCPACDYDVTYRDGILLAMQRIYGEWAGFQLKFRCPACGYDGDSSAFLVDHVVFDNNGLPDFVSISFPSPEFKTRVFKVTREEIF